MPYMRAVVIQAYRVDRFVKGLRGGPCALASVFGDYAARGRCQQAHAHATLGELIRREHAHQAAWRAPIEKNKREPELKVGIWVV